MMEPPETLALITPPGEVTMAQMTCNKHGLAFAAWLVNVDEITHVAIGCAKCMTQGVYRPYPPIPLPDNLKSQLTPRTD